jgi:multiple sugar transport system substrate-binding protein
MAPQSGLFVTSRRRLLLAGGAGTALAACTGGAPSRGGAPAAPTLRSDVSLQLLLTIAAEDQGLFEGVVTGWRNAHPQGPGVEWGTPAGAAIVQKLEALLAASTPPDLITLEPTQAVSFSARGQLLAIDDLIKRDHYDLTDFFRPAVDQYRWKQKLYGLGRGMSNQSMFINQTLFDQAGVPYPPTKATDPGWDFDAFLTTATRLTKRDGSGVTQYGFIVTRGRRGGWAQWVWTNGAEVFDKDFTRCTLDDPRAVVALQLMQDLIYKYRVAPTPKEEADAGGANALFVSSGIVAMRISPVADISTHRRASFSWDYAVNPKGKGRRLTTGGGVGWSILSATRNAEEAWAVFNYLTGPEAARQMATKWYPARKSALDYLNAADPQLPPHSRWVGADGQELLHPDPIFPDYNQIEQSIIAPELNALWNNERPARAVAAAIVPKINDYLKTHPQL